MHAISNALKNELLKLLQPITKLEGSDNKTANLRRRAKLAINKLQKTTKKKQ